MRLRSVLYVPANSVEACGAAVLARPDAVIVDLEDSVRGDAKGQARQELTRAVSALRPAVGTVAVRMNGLDTCWWSDDLDAIVDVGPDVVVVPKVGSLSELDAVRDRWTGSDVTGPTFWPMIESAKGVGIAAELAAARDVSALLIGSSDLAGDLGTSAAVAEAVVLIVEAAAGSQVPVIDGIHLGDRAELEAAFRRSSLVGCSGKSLYTGRDVDLANDAFEAASVAVPGRGT